MSDRMIADKIKVSNVLISDVRKEMGLESPAQNKPKVNRKKGTVNINSPKGNPLVEPPTIEVEKEESDEGEGEMDSLLASAERQPEVTIVPSATAFQTNMAIGSCLDAVISNIGKAVRAADEANQNRKQPTHHKIVLMMLNKALEEVKKWKGAL